MAGSREHIDHARVEWTGNTGQGTADYRAYGRDYDIRADGKPVIAGSSDPAFRGDPARWNPEDLLVASLAACHKLWYLHLCATQGVTVLSYTDDAEGRMVEGGDGDGRFIDACLKPTVVISADSDPEKALALHEMAHGKCFIANSVNFPVRHAPDIVVDGKDA